MAKEEKMASNNTRKPDPPEETFSIMTTTSKSNQNMMQDEDLPQAIDTPQRSPKQKNGELVMELEIIQGDHKTSSITSSAAKSSPFSTTASKLSTPRSSTNNNNTQSTPSSRHKMFLTKSSNGKMTYITMVHEAIIEIGDRTGSSVPAISKFIKAKHEHTKSIKPKQFNGLVTNAIKAGLKEERFVKLKNSYKMNTAWVNKKKSALKAKEAMKKAAERKRKKEAEKLRLDKEKKRKEEKEKEKEKEKERLQKLKEKELEEKKKMMNVMTEEERERNRKKKQEKEEAERKKKVAEAKAKEVADRIKKRRFPMDDLALIAEDKELGVKRPADVTKQPSIPYTMTSLIPFDERPTTRKSTPASIVNACSATMSSGNRGVISDLLQVYHFFRGDVGYSRKYPLTTPDFNFKQLLYAVNEIMIGNAKKSHMVPPLISQMIVASLEILTNPSDDDWAVALASDDDDDINKKRDCLMQDLKTIGNFLNEASWGETLLHYLDLMERFYASDATKDPNALPGYPITLVVGDDDDNDNTSSDEGMSQNDCHSEDGQNGVETNELVDGYHGYIGAPDTAVSRGYMKLLRHDPWHLTAEELIAILRTLTDDIMAMKPELAQDIAERDEALYELLKARKAAESHFRKIRLAYEGPKFPSKSRAKKAADSADNDKNENKSLGKADENGIKNDAKAEMKNEETVKKFKPTATKKQFEAAEKARLKAIDQFEKGMTTLVARTEPFGYDRNYNAFYFFRHDTEMIHVEMNKNTQDDMTQVKSWHCIDSKLLFDEFISSLDVRGVRESSLFEDISGVNGGSNLKKYLTDSNKKNNLLLARKREEEDFERRLNNALIASADQTRRSGRLASVAKDEVAKIQCEMEHAKQAFEKQLEKQREKPNYRALTGMDILLDFEKSNNLNTNWNALCQPDGNTSGMINFIASKILDIESLCEELAPWERSDCPRNAWISNIDDIRNSYERGNTLKLGPKSNADDTITPSKRQRRSLEPSPRGSIACSNPSITQILNALKEPLIDLEARLFSITGLETAVHEADDANDNMSVGSSDSSEITEEQKALEKAKKIDLAWKKKIYMLHSIPTKRASRIRDILICAITIARKGKQSDVPHDLRSALQTHRPGAAGKAKAMALAVLEKYGGFECAIDEMDMIDETHNLADSEAEETKDEGESSKNSSYLCGEALMLTGSLEGNDNADRVDWKDAVKQCKKLSRFSALVAAFSYKAIPKLNKMSEDMETLRKAIVYWETNTKTRKSRSKKKKEKFNSATEIWTDTETTNEFVLGKVDTYPWWPARICIAKDPIIKMSLESLGRVLISFVGEQHLHVVNREDEVTPFTGKEPEDKHIEDYPPGIVKNLRESTAMARRILRGSIPNNNHDGNVVEEKKSST